MKGHDILNRIKELEKEIDTPGFQFGTTKIDPNCLTSPERKLFRMIEDFQEEYGNNPPIDKIEEIHPYLSKAAQILWTRVFDLFHTAMNYAFLKDEKIYQWIFWCRFHAFFETTMNIVEMRRREDEFYRKFEDECGEDWMDVLQEKYGDDWPEPDYSDVGEKDFNKELSSFIRSQASNMRG